MIDAQSGPRRQLSLFDTTNIIVGIIIGAGIYQLAPTIARGVPGPIALLGLWTLGAVLSFCGALAYAELASAYPACGGDCVYLRRAYGPWAGFLFGWIQMTIVRPSDIALMAFAFATYARTLYDPWPAHPAWAQRVVAVLSVILLTGVNVLGVRQGKWAQNVLTVAKALGLLLVVGVATVASPAAGATTAQSADGGLPLSVALVLVLFIYGGWNEVAFVAAEVRDSRRNITRAIVLGLGAVWLLYLLANGAFLRTLGFAGLRASEAVGTDTVAVLLPRAGARLIAVLVCVSALGAVNGLIFAGARISYAVGRDYRAFRGLGRWSPRSGTPIRALLLQGGISVILIVAFGSFLDTLLYMAPAVYLFYLGTNLAVIVLRRREPAIERPFRVPLFPLPNLIFGGVCLFLIYSTLTYAWGTRPYSLLVLGILIASGLITYRLCERSRPGRRPVVSPPPPNSQSRSSSTASRRPSRS